MTLLPLPFLRPRRVLTGHLSPLVAVAVAMLCARADAQLAPTPAPRVEGSTNRIPLGLSNLIVRLDGQDEIGMARQDLRVHVLERLRERGFYAVGAESLVFDKDESHRAAFRLGAVIRELRCLPRESGLGCRLGVEWQLLDVAQDAIVYTALTRSALLDVRESQKQRLPNQLLLGALDSLLRRPGFLAMLTAQREVKPVAPLVFPQATFARCASPGQPMPAASDWVLNATALLRTSRGFGSGFFLSSDGLLLTAAHLIEGDGIKLRLRNGTEVEAVPIRVDPRLDVALLRTTRPLTGQACLLPSSATPQPGTEVYALGAPADETLAFSITRGIVSGLRNTDGRNRLQTDAAVSGGNSGGPLVDTRGEAIAVVTSKLVGKTIEGIAFSTPITEALTALGLTADQTTDPLLLAAVPHVVPPSPRPAPIVDAPDAVPTLDPEADQAALETQRREERSNRTPHHVKALFWGGLGLTIVGGITGAATYGLYDDKRTTPQEFKNLQAYNTVGLTAAGIGVAAMVTFFALRPPLPPLPGTNQSALVIGPGSLRLEGSF